RAPSGGGLLAGGDRRQPSVARRHDDCPPSWRPFGRPIAPRRQQPLELRAVRPQFRRRFPVSDAGVHCMSETAAPAQAQTLGFKAEVRELLKLMIHSLYSHREIFLRELISNASDANDKLRFLSLANADLLGKEQELAVWVSADEKAGTVTIRDNGIG